MLPHWNCHCCCSILLSHPQVYAHCIAYFCAFIFSLYFLNRFCFCCVLCTHTHTYASTHSLYVVCIAVATMARREELKNCSYGLLPAASWGIRLILWIYFFFLLLFLLFALLCQRCAAFVILLANALWHRAHPLSMNGWSATTEAQQLRTSPVVYATGLCCNLCLAFCIRRIFPFLRSNILDMCVCCWISMCVLHLI